MGIVSGFIGQTIGDQIVNFIEGGDEFTLLTLDEGYLAAIISSGACAIIVKHLDDFKTVILSVGLYYVVYQSILEYTNKEILSQDDLLKEVLIDIIIIYIIVKLKEEFVFMFFNVPKKEDSDGDFGDLVVFTIINSIIITSYYSIKRYYNDKKSI